jgi:hypothetical protein
MSLSTEYIFETEIMDGEMKKPPLWSMVLIMATLIVSLKGCVLEKRSMVIENSLPESQLAYYNDSFDRLRQDIWMTSALVYSKGQMSNFKLARMSIESGRLKITTKRKCFSRNGLFSKFALRGDFDIQVDCQFDFSQNISDMDQVVRFGVTEKGNELSSLSCVVINLLKRPQHHHGQIVSAFQWKGKLHIGNRHALNSFKGTLRIVRKGNQAGTFYKEADQLEWKKMNTFHFMKIDMYPCFYLLNFMNDRTSISAKSSITVLFDNFRINAAQEILEMEI